MSLSSSSTGMDTNCTLVTNTIISATDAPDTVWKYFLSLVIIILFHRLIGTLVHKFFHIPRIIGDIIAGCMLGPTIMGASANHWLFPDDNIRVVDCLGQFGLIMTSLSAGFSFDHRVLRGQTIKVSMYTLFNMCVPALISLPLFYALPDNGDWRGSGYHSGAYFLLVVCALSSSALPMVFLILSELHVVNDIARFAIGFSCLSTIALFTLLSIASTLADNTLSKSLIALHLLFLFLVFVFLAVMQWLWSHLLSRSDISKRILNHLKYGSDDMTIIVIALALVSAIISDRLGYTFLIGAFLCGAAMPFDSGLRSCLGEKIRWMTRWIFLPQFFVTAGLKFDLRKIHADSIPYILLFLILAFFGKALLVPITRYLLGMTWKDSAFCASLANCRGFNALIVGSFGIQYNLIGDSFFVACVLLSILSTTAAGPLAKMWKPDADQQIRTIESTPAVVSNAALGVGGTGSHKEPLSPKSGHQQRGSSDELMLDSHQIASDDHSSVVRIIFPSDASSSSAAPVVPPTPATAARRRAAEREELFSSWLSESYAQKSNVLVIIAEELRRKILDPQTTLATDRSSGETRFRGDLFVDFLCEIYNLDTRATALAAGQKLLEAGFLLPVNHPLFVDQNVQYTIG